MSRVQEYPARYSDGKTTSLPTEVQNVCYELGSALRSYAVTPNQLVRLRRSYLDVPAETIPRASNEIKKIAQLFGTTDIISHQNRSALSQPFFSENPDIRTQLDQFPDLGWLLIYHGNGYVRQVAIESLSGAPQCPFEFSAIIYRLNDWVENVRETTTVYCKKHLENTSSKVIAESAFFLLHQARVLNRWDGTAQKLLDDLIYDPEVIVQLKDIFLGARSGRVGHTFRQLLQRPEFDSHLAMLSSEAALPSIRAIAAESLLMKRAQWFAGHRDEWIDKRYGIKKKVIVFDCRPINIKIEGDLVLKNAVRDPSAQVRKIAADALIVRRHEASEKLDELANILANDPNTSVRARADFYLTKRAQNN